MDRETQPVVFPRGIRLSCWSLDGVVLIGRFPDGVPYALYGPWSWWRRLGRALFCRLPDGGLRHWVYRCLR